MRRSRYDDEPELVREKVYGGRTMDLETIIRKAAQALLAMQRYSWEQGVAMQAFLEMGNKDVVTAMAHEAVYRRMEDGRAATIGVTDAATDPCSVGEALLAACEWTGDAALIEGKDALLEWALHTAPRNDAGVVYHLTNSKQFWVDSAYMLPPFLAAAGHIPEALVNFYGYVDALYDTKARLMSHMWDDEAGCFLRAAHWGTGNGWTLAAAARLIPVLEASGYEADVQRIVKLVRELLDSLMNYMRADGLFYDVVDDPGSFVETNLSQMAAYTIYRGMAGGWLDDRYAKAADHMRTAARGKVNAFGFVADVCGAPSFDKPGFSPEGQAFFLLMESAARNYENLINKNCEGSGSGE